MVLYNIITTTEELNHNKLPLAAYCELGLQIYLDWFPDRWMRYYQWKRMQPGFGYLNHSHFTTQHLKEQLARGFVLRKEFDINYDYDYYIRSLIADLVYPKTWDNQMDAIKYLNRIGLEGCNGIVNPKKS